MRICIGGKNNIAVNVCSHLLSIFPKDILYAIPNRNDDGKDNYQRSFLKYLIKENIRIVNLEDLYDWDDLIFLSLEFDRIINPTKFKTRKLFNLHFSLLPAYKGVFTSALPILFDEKYGGVTLHYIDNGIDTGDIIDQVRFTIPSDYNAIELYSRCILEGTELVIRNFNILLSDNIEATPQPIIGSTYFSTNSLNYSNPIINLKATAHQIDCQVRALCFRPFQLPELECTPIFFTEITAERSVKRPGTIIDNNQNFFRVATIDYDILLYKDRLADVLVFCESNDLKGLVNISHYEKYINEREKTHGWSPMIVAAYRNSFDVLRFLVENGGDLNITNYNGTSIVMYAKEGALISGGFQSIDYLLEKGADPNKKDYQDKDIFDYIDETMPVFEHIINYRQ